MRPWTNPDWLPSICPASSCFTATRLFSSFHVRKSHVQKKNLYIWIQSACKYCRDFHSHLSIRSHTFRLHAGWMQMVQLCTHDVIIISSVNNERVQLHTNRRVRPASLSGWMESGLVHLCWESGVDLSASIVYSQSWIMCFSQTDVDQKMALHSEPLAGL